MTIKDIAKMAGVSISTVSKIVNNKDVNINQETRNRVLKIVKEYNYTPYGTVKNISTAKTFILGVLMKDIRNSENMLQGILHKAQEKGYCVIPMDSRNSAEDELKHITALCKNKADGILWEPVSGESLGNRHYFEQSGIPVYFFNSATVPGAWRIDYEKAGRLCAQTLLEHRHKKICCLIRKEDSISQQFLDGFKSCLFDGQIPFTDDMAYAWAPEKEDFALPLENYTGLLCSVPEDALLVYERLLIRHYHVPSDVSVITAGAAPKNSPVSSYGLPFYELGRAACGQLISLCEKNTDKEGPDSPQLPYVLNNKNSLGKAPDCGGKKFLILGSINADITFIVDGQIQTGKSAVITDSSSIAGGKGPNQAVASARLGHEAILVGKVGNDHEAGLIFDILDKEKLPSDGITRDFDTPTGKAYIYLQKDGEGATTYLPGANLKLSARDICRRSDLFKDCSYCLLSTDVPMEAVIQAASTARQMSVKTILKPSAMNVLPDILYQKTDIFIPNKTEAATFCPAKYSHCVEDEAEYFYNKGIPTVIITLGHKGCYVHTKHIRRHFPAPNFPAVDTIGGADAFIAALACYLSDGYPLEKAVAIAQYAAGFCVSHRGVTPALVDRETLHADIEQREPDLLLF